MNLRRIAQRVCARWLVGKAQIILATRELPAPLQRALSSVGYRRPDVHVEAGSFYSPREGTSVFEGNRGFVVVVNLQTGMYKEYEGSWGGVSPFSKSPVDLDRNEYPIPENGAVIIGSSGGRGSYAHIRVHPSVLAMLEKQLPPAGEGLSEQELDALRIVQGLISSARPDAFRRNKLGPYRADAPLIAGLIRKGLLKANRAGSIRITPQGKTEVIRAPRKTL